MFLLKSSILAAEDLGYESLWVADHLMMDGLRKACDGAGRDFGSIKKSVETQVMNAPTRGDVDRLRDEISERNPSLYDDAEWKQAEEQYLIGDPETVIARISEYRSIGVDYMQLWIMDMPSEQGLRTFAESVAPAFSGRWVLTRLDSGVISTGKFRVAIARWRQATPENAKQLTRGLFSGFS